MSVLLSCQSIAKSYTRGTLFKDVSMGIFEGDKIGLIGPNGAGKSTLLKILAGIVEPDQGERALRNHTKMAYVPQISDFSGHKGSSVEDVLLHAMKDIQQEEYEKITQVNTVLSKVGFTDPDQQVDILSGGWKKRLSIAVALVQEPDLLLLDEPTNHLDMEGILWLESLLKQASFAFLVITHDRAFLEEVSTSIIELNACYKDFLFRVEGNYSKFLEKKEEYLNEQSQLQQSLETKVRREVEWLRRGPKARTTKAKYRIQEAGRLIQQLSDVKTRNKTSQAQIDFDSSGRKTKRLAVLEDVSKQMGDKKLFSGLNLTLTPGVRMGLLGTNGSGKTTFLRLLTGELEPDEGSVFRADQLKVVYFSQLREKPNPELTLRKALSPDGDTVIYRDKPLHVSSWAKKFLFHTDQLDVKLGLLSGGEQARVQIANLMQQPADILLLDEPTNDLDIPTLDVLEETLTDFPGVLVLVTHDRFMLDRICNVMLGLDGEYTGLYADYPQWEEARRQRQKALREQKKKEEEAKKTQKSHTQKAKSKGLTYNEKREYEQIEQKIMEAEEDLEAKQAKLQDPEIASDPGMLQECYQAVNEAEAEVEKLYARWTELAEKANG